MLKNPRFTLTQNFTPVFQKVSFVQQSVQAFFSLHSFLLFPGICPSVRKVFQAYSCKAYQDLYKGGGIKLVHSVSHFG